MRCESIRVEVNQLYSLIYYGIMQEPHGGLLDVHLDEHDVVVLEDALRRPE